MAMKSQLGVGREEIRVSLTKKKKMVIDGETRIEC